ncbi:hypothetical protein GCM10022294_27750 [Dietzia aurantiaca]
MGAPFEEWAHLSGGGRNHLNPSWENANGFDHSTADPEPNTGRGPRRPSPPARHPVSRRLQTAAAAKRPRHKGQSDSVQFISAATAELEETTCPTFNQRTSPGR